MSSPMEPKRIDMHQAAAKLAAADGILVVCHKCPDGDAWGSAFALCGALLSLGKRAAVAGASELPALYAYLRPLAGGLPGEPGLVVSVDCSTLERLLVPQPAVDLSIDHHSAASLYAAETFCRPESASCAELVLGIIDLLGAPVTPAVAAAIYTGLSTDTGCFRFANTTPDTHRAAARMIECGADAGELNRILFDTRTAAQIHLERALLDSLRLFEGGQVAVARITLADIAACRAVETDYDGLSAVPRSVEGVRFGILLRQIEGGWKGSVRTVHDSAAAVAMAFGGGGHIRAAGFEAAGDADALTKKIVEECRKQL